MVNYSPPTAADENRWSRRMKHVLQDPKGRHYFKQFVTERNIPLPQDYPQTQPEKLEHLHGPFMDYIPSLRPRN